MIIPYRFTFIFKLNSDPADFFLSPSLLYHKRTISEKVSLARFPVRRKYEYCDSTEDYEHVNRHIGVQTCSGSYGLNTNLVHSSVYLFLIAIAFFPALYHSEG